MSVAYTTSLAGITAERLGGGFFEGWPTRPSADAHLAILRGSEVVVLAIDEDAPGAPVVGFVTAIGDGVLAASIPLLEVLPAYRGRGIGGELVRRVLDALRDRYMVDLVCDEELVPFYERFGLAPYRAMIVRRRDAIAALAGDDRSRTDVRSATTRR